MDYDIFKDNSEKQLARQRLPELEASFGWKLVLKAMDINIAHLQEELKIKRDHESIEQVYLTLDRINDLQKLKQLPKLLLQAAAEDPSDPAPDEEIYDSPGDTPTNPTT